MNKIIQALSLIANRAFTDFAEGGGIVRHASDEMQPGILSANNGALPAIVWVVEEFAGGYGFEFPKLQFATSPNSLTGYELASINASGSASPIVLMLSDFLRHEMLSKRAVDHGLGEEILVECNIDLLIANFKEWCASNVLDVDNSMDTSKSSTIRHAD